MGRPSHSFPFPASIILAVMRWPQRISGRVGALFLLHSYMQVIILARGIDFSDPAPDPIALLRLAFFAFSTSHSVAQSTLHVGWHAVRVLAVATLSAQLQLDPILMGACRYLV